MYLVEISFLSYNRINLLINRLKYLIFKIDHFNLNEYICISIFDNCSEEIEVKKLKDFLTSISHKNNIYFFQNNLNLGFPGNLEKSIINSKAFYKWLLSDDDFLNLTFLPNIILLLKQKKIDFLSLKTIAVNNPPKENKYEKIHSFNICEFYKPDVNKFLNNKQRIDLDKNLGFISSNIIKTSFLKLSLKQIKAHNRKLLNNNYLIKAINYNALNKINILGIFDYIPVVFQNIKEGSYFYNDPLLRRKTFIFDSTEIYLYIKKLKNINLNDKSKQFIEKRIYLNLSLWISLKKDKLLKISDILYVYKNSQRIYPSIFLIYLLPIFLIRKLIFLKHLNLFKFIRKN